MRAEVYRNLHTGTWSVRDLSTGLVVDHPDSIVIEDAKFVVQPAGRERVLREQRKNVHAFVRGVVSTEPYSSEGFERVSYNPYAGASFAAKDGTEVYSADVVVMNPTGVYALVER